MKLERILKKLPKGIAEELAAMPQAELERAIVNSEEAIATAVRELEENPRYQEIKQAKSDLSAGLREVKSYQTAKIHYALHLLREAGKV